LTGPLFLPGAGGGASLWAPLATRFGGRVVPLPRARSVATIADALSAEVVDAREPPLLVGNSLGALVAIELARRAPVAGLFLLAAGWEFPVADSVLAAAEGATARARTYARIADRCLAPTADSDLLAAVAADFAGREPGTLADHLVAIRDHQQPDLGPQAPPTMLIAGGRDRSVTLRDQVELAGHLKAMFVQIPESAHMPFVDHREEVALWLERLLAIVRTERLTPVGVQA
jgi:pimeloyl-ACP methyl ester carboxylesterase